MVELTIKVVEHSFDTCVSLTFSATTLGPLVAKNGRKQVNNTNLGLMKLTYVPLPWQHE